MNIGPHELAIIEQGLRKKGLSRLAFAQALGLEKTWATRFLKGAFKSVSDERKAAIEKLLGVQFRAGGDNRPQASPLAMEVTARIVDSKPLAELFDAAMRLHESSRGMPVRCAPWIPTKAMRSVGEQIIAIADANREKPGKVAKLVQKLLADQ
jgi:transcriptional regulator with XRE-family HTH domain